MNNKQLDAVLEYLNDDNGTVTIEDVKVQCLNESIVDKVKKSISGFKPMTKSLFGNLFKKNRTNAEDVIKIFDLEKVEGKDDLYICHKYKINGMNPYIKAPLDLIAPYPNNMKLFLQWSNSDADWDKIFKSSWANRAKIDTTDVDSDITKKDAKGVLVIKGFSGNYVLYKTYVFYAIKSKTLKNAKWHTAVYEFDGGTEYTGWSENTPEDFSLDDLIK